jgi:ABC-type Na+ efflux pump permease subunit
MVVCPLTRTVLLNGSYFSFMIQTQGFASSQSIGSLTDEINRWMVSNTQGMDTKFRLIDIKYASSAESDASHSHVNYSALVVYEVGEIKKSDDSAEPLDASGVK